ncbi:PREDICTED: C-type lectin domain family 5 member A [Chrysochloris asiatica]|uniref:C-type lectin domain family 5 member A n=1 Tax=Chrysochloris asiatica TaxID=185453 RepID=A0A9B0WLP2_CHRAS|nr:PREDICTED: C-type lectin domain family 5 member A [Chrysochloris asiatica]
MNWHMIISALIVVVLKVIGMTFFLLHCEEIFSYSSIGFTPNTYFSSLMSPECPRGWNLNSGRCFFLSTTELPWENSRKSCEDEGSSLAIVNTQEKLTFLKDKISAEKYFIGLVYQPSEKRWRWINNSAFTGNVTSYSQDFHCVTIGPTTTFDSALCDISYRWICEKKAK